jgi:hypothetical protein
MIMSFFSDTAYIFYHYRMDMERCAQFIRMLFHLLSHQF